MASIFGGGQPDEVSASSSGDESIASVSSLHSVQNEVVQPDPEAQHLHPDPDEFAAESDESDLSGDDRPNRFTRHPRTWFKEIEDERRILSTLEQQRAGDLSAHLYNAFAYRRRLRQSAETIRSIPNWKHKDRWFDNSEGSAWKPPPGWTKWPLEPQFVPHVDEEFKRNANVSLDGSTITAQKADFPRTDMEDLILATILKQAHSKFKERTGASDKDRWEKALSILRKEGQDEDLPVDEDGSSQADSSIAPENNQPASLSETPRSPERSNLDASDVEETQGQSKASGKSTDDEDGSTSFRDSTSEIDELPAPETSSENLPEAVFMADDERARLLLQPTVNSILSKLDSLLLALHHSRCNRLDEVGPDDEDNDRNRESDTEAEPEKHPPRSTTNRRKRGRPPVIVESTNSGPRNRKFGRPPIYPQPLPGESYYMMRKRLDKTYMTKKKLVEGSASEEEQPAPRGARVDQAGRNSEAEDVFTDASDGRKPSKRRTGHDAATERPDRIRLRDWSDVVGLASTTGWDEAVVSRAAKRCSALFGEGMRFHTLQEDAALKPIPKPVEYLPEEIRPPTEFDEASDDAQEAEQRPYWDRNSLSCPHPNCYGHHKKFAIANRVVEHIKREHGYDPRTVPMAEEGALEGGVHIDGFLRPIYPKQGWRGKDAKASAKRKQRKAKGRSKSEADGMSMDEGG